MPRFANKIKLGFLLTGNEVTSGDILDTNSLFLAKAFADIGLRTSVKTALPDDLQAIAAMIPQMAKELDILVVNGGLGATVDDMTAEAAALAGKVTLVEHPLAIAHIEGKTGIRRQVAKSLQFKQALFPAGAELIDNPVGLAMGFAMVIEGCHCFFTPGVPSELKAMMPLILERVMAPFGLKKPVELHRLNVLGVGESRIQQMIHARLPPERFEHLELGFRIDSPFVEVKLTCFEDEHLPLLRQTSQLVNEIFQDYVFSQGPSLAATVNELLADQGKTLTLAESCTGGLISSLVTAVPGASRVLESSFVTYSYASKTLLLGVEADLLADLGAVCSEVVLAMAQGALEKTGADYAIAVSGIAGPGGGTDEKPVGMVHLAWGRRGDLQHRKLWIQKERSQFQLYTAMAALDFLRRYLQGFPTNHPLYFDSLTRHLLPRD